MILNAITRPGDQSPISLDEVPEMRFDQVLEHDDEDLVLGR